MAAAAKTMMTSGRRPNLSRLGGEGLATGIVPIFYGIGGVSGVARGSAGAGD